MRYTELITVRHTRYFIKNIYRFFFTTNVRVPDNFQEIWKRNRHLRFSIALFRRPVFGTHISYWYRIAISFFFFFTLSSYVFSKRKSIFYSKITIIIIVLVGPNGDRIDCKNRHKYELCENEADADGADFYFLFSTLTVESSGLDFNGGNCEVNSKVENGKISLKH